MDLSIITINYNLSIEIKECINSIIQKVTGIEYEIIVVDNNSKDKESRLLDKHFPPEVYPNIHFYFLDENLGFGRGCNYGVSKSKGKVICCLNPDTIIQENIFPEILGYLDQNKTAGVVGPRLNENDGAFDYSSGYFPNFTLELLNIIFLGRYYEAYCVRRKAIKNNNKPFEVQWVMGAALFIKADVFHKVDGYDKDFFLFFEELDLCFNVIKAGYKIIYLPAISVFHHGSVTVKKNYASFTELFYKSKLLFIKKQYPKAEKIVLEFLIFFQLISQICLWSVLYFNNKDKSKGKIKGLFAVFPDVFKSLKKLI